MNSEKHFDSRFVTLDKFATEVLDDEIKNEPMFFNSDLEFAYDKGGPITRSFINNLPDVVQEQPCVVVQAERAAKGMFPYWTETPLYALPGDRRR